ncbi:MAG: hypothetical protein JO248_12225 [Acidimicrobiia bacterium]|nr:hypothetical protein [Acidimicrobiia bacterium]
MDAEVEALYGLPLDEFTKARDTLAKARAKEQGKEAGAAVKALRKPSVTAWALNQLARRHPDDIDALVEAGARLRRAQTAALEGGDPDELREATKAEAGEVRALAGQARSILAETGRGDSAAQEERLATTLRAAAVNDLAADLLRRGVLTEELSAAGFGFGIGEGDLPDEAFSARSTESREKQDRDDGERRRQMEQEAKEQEANRRELRALEKELQAVRDTAVRLTKAADDADRRAMEAREKAIDAAGRAERLAADVERLKRKGPKNE